MPIHNILQYIFSGLLRAFALAMTVVGDRHTHTPHRHSRESGNPGKIFKNTFLHKTIYDRSHNSRNEVCIVSNTFWVPAFAGMTNFLRSVALFSLILLLTASPLYAKETLTVYTHSAFMSSSYGPGILLKEAFEKTCDCEIHYVVLDTIPLVINRINFEGEKTKADVVLGLEDIGLDVNHVDKLIPYASHCLAFVYDATKIPCPPKTLDELINSSHPLILQDPRSSITGLGFLVWMKKAYGFEAPQKWKTLASHVLTFTKGWTEAYALFKKGIAPIVLSYTTDGLFNELEKEMPHLKALHFPEGHLCSNIYAGKLKTTHHSELANQFLDFLLSAEAQHLIATHAWIYPKGDIPEAWLKAENYFPQPIWVSYTSKEVKDAQRAWIQEWVEGLIQ